MTAPGQEPDEVLSRRPDPESDTPPPAHPEVDRSEIGDSHMPADVRREARREAAEEAEDAQSRTSTREPGDDSPDEGED